MRFKILIQNIQKTLDQTQHKKELFWTILDNPIHYLKIATHHVMFLKLNLHINCIKRFDINFQQFLTIITNT